MGVPPEEKKFKTLFLSHTHPSPSDSFSLSAPLSLCRSRFVSRSVSLSVLSHNIESPAIPICPPPTHLHTHTHIHTVCYLHQCLASRPILLLSLVSVTFASYKQSQLSGVGLSAGSYKHDHLVMRVFRDVATVDQHDLVTFQQPGLNPPRLQSIQQVKSHWIHLKYCLQMHYLHR